MCSNKYYCLLKKKKNTQQLLDLRSLPLRAFPIGSPKLTLEIKHTKNTF